MSDLTNLNDNDLSFIKLILIANGGTRANRLASMITLERLREVATPVVPKKKRKRRAKKVKPYRTPPDYEAIK